MDGRYPQSPQSVPSPHVAAEDPGPPSSQTPLLEREVPVAASAHVLPHAQLLRSPVITLVPSHVPPRHWLHEARVDVLPPPDVNQPGRHVLQRSADPVEYVLSAPHGEHALLPTALNEPGGQLATLLDPVGHLVPALHLVQVDRVVSFTPPAV